MMLTEKLRTAAGWALGRVLPVDHHKVVFSCYYGRGYGDSQKAIAEELLRRNKNLKLVWLTADQNAAESLPDGIKACSYHSIRRGIALGTAKVWVDNCRKGARFKKKGQQYLQTWHGFALKRIEKDAVANLPPEYPAYAERDSSQIDLLVSDSRFMTEVYRSAFWYGGEIAEFGLPRNDSLIRRKPDTATVVRKALGVPVEEKLVLYAPTFRVDHSMEACSLDFARLKKACERRFGGSFTVLVRLHPNVAGLAEDYLKPWPQVVDATAYPDGQALLETADVLVTDYSSIMFDFMLTERPCFQFATDIAAYRNDRNFYMSLDALPFPLAEDDAALELAILQFDETAYRSSVEGFIAEQGIVTDGLAAARCADWILAQLER